jgi:hypothetical protein
VKDLIDGIIGEDVGFGFSAFEMKLDVASRVVEAERFEGVSKREARAERFEDAEFEDLKEAFDTANKNAETVFRVEVECGEAP